MSIILKGGNNSNLANVDVNSNVSVNLPMTANTAGYATMVAEIDNGVASGTRTVLGTYVSDSRRLSVGIDTPMLNYTFNSAAQDSGVWRYFTS